MKKAFALLMLLVLSAQLFAAQEVAQQPPSQKLVKPQRIVSLSLCTDQLILKLVEPRRIAAVSDLAPDEIYSDMADQAKGLSIHYGLAEQIIPLNPDLIIGSTYSANNTVQMLRQLGHPVTTVDSPTTIAEIASFTRAIGLAVGEPERAEIIIQAMHQEIEAAKRLVADKPKQLAISYGPNGYTPGRKSLKHQVLEAAGYRNLAAELGIEYAGNLSVEQLAIANPDAVIIDESIPNQDSLAQNFVNHPLLKKLFQGTRMPHIPTRYWLCPGPSVSKAILSLAEQRQ